MLSPAVRPLPWQREDREVAPGTLCDVAGWGVVNHAGRRPDRLQHVLLPVLDRATCNQRTYHDGAITQRMMCAESNRRDSCKVHSGRGCGERGRAYKEMGLLKRRDPGKWSTGRGGWSPGMGEMVAKGQDLCSDGVSGTEERQVPERAG